MHILIIPSEQFIVKNSPNSGIFQLHQAKVLIGDGHKIGVISSDVLLPSQLFKKIDYKKNEVIEGINILRHFRKTFIPNRLRKNSEQHYQKQQLKLGVSLYLDYVNKYGRPDVIHAHNFIFAGLIAEAINNKFEVPYVITEHSSNFAMGKIDKIYNSKLKKCAKNSSVMTAVSTSFVNLLNIKFNITNIKVLPNLVDDLFFENIKNENNNQGFIFLNIASFDNNKNQTLLIKSFANKFKNRNFHLKLGGVGGTEEKLKKMVHKLGINKQVTFLGQLPQRKVKQEMTNADCFVLTSHYETFGVVLIESLACGTPVISTKCGGPEDIVNEHCGLLIDVNNQDQLELAMELLSNDKKKYDKEKLISYARENYGSQAFIKNIMVHYKNAIS